MRYPVLIEPDGKFFLVTFPDIPEAITQGESAEEAEEAAKDALATALGFYLEQGHEVPTPSKAKPGQSFVELPVDYTLERG